MSKGFDKEFFESRAIPLPDKDPEPPKDGWTFHVSQKEIAEYYRWSREHHEKHHGGKYPYCGAVGGQMTFTFVSTGLGQIAGVECNVCHAKGMDKLDYMNCITDFEDW